MKVGDLEHFKNMFFLAHSARWALRIVFTILRQHYFANLSQNYSAVAKYCDNFGPSLSNHNSVIRPFIIMPNFVFVVLLTNMVSIKGNDVKMCIQGGPKTEKCHLLQKPLLAIFAHSFIVES